MGVDFLAELFDVARCHIQQRHQPAIGESTLQQINGLDRRLVEVQQLREQCDVVYFDLVQADADVAVRLAARWALMRRLQRVDDDDLAEEVPEARQHRASALVPGCPGVLAVHVENEAHGRPGLDQATQQEPCQHALAAS